MSIPNDDATPDYKESTDGVFSLNLAGGEADFVAWTLRFEATFGPEFELTDEYAVIYGQQVQQMLSGIFPLGSENSEAILRAMVVHVLGEAPAPPVRRFEPVNPWGEVKPAAPVRSHRFPVRGTAEYAAQIARDF